MCGDGGHYGVVEIVAYDKGAVEVTVNIVDPILAPATFEIVELPDELGDPVLDDQGDPVAAVTSDGGFYLFEDLDPGTYRLHEVQPTDVDDGAEILGSLGGAIPANDVCSMMNEQGDK